MSPLLTAPSLQRLLMTARYRLRFAALLRGLAPGLWLAALALLVLWLLPGTPGWEIVTLIIGTAMLATVGFRLYQTDTDTAKAATAADYWLSSYGVITTAADILTRKPSTLNAAEKQVLQEAMRQAPAWTQTLRQQVTFNPGRGLATALATLLVALFLLSLESPDAYDPTFPDRVSPDRVSPDRVTANQLSTTGPELRTSGARGSGAPALQAGVETKISPAPVEGNSLPRLPVNDAVAMPGAPASVPSQASVQTLAAPTPANPSALRTASAATPRTTSSAQLSVTEAAIPRRGNGTTSAAGQDNTVTGVASANELRDIQLISDTPNYQPFLTGSSAAIVRRFFARQESFDE